MDKYNNTTEDIKFYLNYYLRNIHLNKIINYGNYWKVFIISIYDMNINIPNAIILDLIKEYIYGGYNIKIEFLMSFNHKISLYNI